MRNPFFLNKGPIEISEILNILNLNHINTDLNLKIFDINDLFESNINEITFFHTLKYKEIAKQTKASFCLTTENLKNYLPKSCMPIIVKNVLVSTV